MKYPEPGMQQAVQSGSGLQQEVGPQLITRLENQVRGLIELRGLLRGTNKKLRGIQPPPANGTNSASDIPKPLEQSLMDLTRDIERLLEECHAEASEASAILS